MSEHKKLQNDIKEWNEMVKEILQKEAHDPVLTETERKALNLYYFDKKNNEEVADILGVTREKTRRIREQAITKLRFKFL